MEAIVKYAQGFTEQQIQTLLKTTRHGLTDEQIDSMVKTVEPLIVSAEARVWLRHQLAVFANYELPNALTGEFYEGPLKQHDWRELEAVSRAAIQFCKAIRALGEKASAHLHYHLVNSVSSLPDDIHNRSDEAEKWLSDTAHRAELIATVESADRDGLGVGRPKEATKMWIVIQLAEMFHQATLQQATRRVTRPPGAQTDTGPFYNFVAAFWVAAFGSTIGLSSAMKNGELSQVLSNRRMAKTQ